MASISKPKVAWRRPEAVLGGLDGDWRVAEGGLVIEPQGGCSSNFKTGKCAMYCALCMPDYIWQLPNVAMSDEH